MKNTGIVQFTDRDSSDEAIVIVRHDDTTVELALSLKSDGDIAAFMGKDEARSVIELLRKAVAE